MLASVFVVSFFLSCKQCNMENPLQAYCDCDDKLGSCGSATGAITIYIYMHMRQHKVFSVWLVVRAL